MTLAAGFDASLSGARAYRPAHPLERVVKPIETVRLVVLYVMVLGGALVIAEPSPYEIGAVLALLVFALSGAIRLRGVHMPLVFLLIVYCLGITASAIPVLGRPKVAVWVVISWYLAATAILFACILTENTARRLDMIVRAWTLAALIAAVAGILGYFRAFPGAFDLFTLYGRAKGTFNDPNVFGPFLILPMLFAMQILFTGAPRAMLKAGAILAILGVAMLLSFSRGAWIHFALSAFVMTFLIFVTSRSTGERARILLLIGAAVVLLAALLAALLSIDKVADLMRERASFSQSYDLGPMGRFGRHAYGWNLALDNVNGIGAMQFRTIFPEDPHNVYLNSFMAGGWAGGLTYLVLVVVTLVIGAVAVFQNTPWRHVTIAVFAVYVGLVGLGRIIDTDHWRHFWLILGLLWGLALANRIVLADARRAAALAAEGKIA